MRHKLIGLVIFSLFGVSLAGAATFGKVVPIGGHAADIALDEGRGVLYIANYTSGRIDVMSLADNSVGRSMTVAAYPGGLALSPDGRYLVITHYASLNGSSLMQPGRDAVTIVDLNDGNKQRTFGMSSGPVGVAFGGDGLALILTQDELLLLDPASGSTSVLTSVANVKSQALPVEQPNFPPQIIAGALTATADGTHIIGIGGTTPDTGDNSVFLLFSYNVRNRQLTANFGVSSVPSLGPRAISASRDGHYYMTGWGLLGCGVGFLGDCTAAGPLLAQWPNTTGQSISLNVGTVAVRSSKATVYAQILAEAAKPPSTETVCTPSGVCITVTTPTTTPTTSKDVSSVPPGLMVMDADNLTVRERIQIPENLAGRSVFNSDESVLYSISDSGVLVLDLKDLDRAPRVLPSQEDVVFRGNFCNTGAITQEISVADPSGRAVPFQVCQSGNATCSLPRGVAITPSAGVTPATIRITVDPSQMSSLLGTTSFVFELRSAVAVNMPPPPTRGRLETDYIPGVRSRFRVLVNNREPQNRGAIFNIPGELVDVLADGARNRFYVLRQDKNQVLVFDAASYNQIATLRTGNTPTQLALTLDGKYLLVANDNSQIANRFDLDTLQAAPPIVFPLGHYPRSIAVSGRAILAASRVAGPVHTIDAIDLITSSAATLPSLGPYKNDVHESTTLTATPNGAAIMAAMPDGRVLLYNANVNSFTIARKDFTALKGGLAASNFGLYMVDHYLLNESLVQQGQVVPNADLSSGFAFVNEQAYSVAVSSTKTGYIQRLSAAGIPLPTMMVESPLVGDTDFPFRRTLAPLADQSGIIALTTSGFTVLPWNYDAATAPPVLDRVVSAADFTKPVAPGGLASIFGRQLSPLSLSTKDFPLPTVLGDSCLTVNGAITHVTFVSPSQINAQLPSQVTGSAEMVLRTPGGTSDALRFTVSSTAPSVFRSGTAGPATDIPTVVRQVNDGLVTASNPIHLNDRLTIYLTGMGKTSPEVPDGAAAPANPLATALVRPAVTLGGAPLFVDFAGLTPGYVGVGQINVQVPFKGVPTGFDIPLTITQGGSSTTVLVRVVD